MPHSPNLKRNMLVTCQQTWILLKTQAHKQYLVVGKKMVVYFKPMLGSKTNETNCWVKLNLTQHFRLKQPSGRVCPFLIQPWLEKNPAFFKLYINTVLFFQMKHVYQTCGTARTVELTVHSVDRSSGDWSQGRTFWKVS